MASELSSVEPDGDRTPCEPSGTDLSEEGAARCALAESFRLRSDVGKARPGSGLLAAGTRGDLIPAVDLGVSDTLRSVDADALDRIGGV
jgi:hypothetical protein